MGPSSSPLTCSQLSHVTAETPPESTIHFLFPALQSQEITREIRTQRLFHLLTGRGIIILGLPEQRLLRRAGQCMGSLVHSVEAGYTGELWGLGCQSMGKGLMLFGDRRASSL